MVASFHQPQALAAAPPPFPSSQDTPTPRRSPVVDVFDAAKDAVVNISSTQIVQLRSPTGFERFFEEFFDVPTATPFTRKYKLASVGSGFVLHPAGYIVTNAHVVARTAERKVIFADQTSFDAHVVAIDHERDLAILKIDPPHALTPVKLGHSNDLMVGETVIAIGNPMGLQHTVTAGVVSALDRTLDFDDRHSLKGLIQTDASINPGNSGGPLLNILGQLIGINTAIRGDAQNIGFAIPVDQLRAVLPQLLDVERRYRISTGLRLSPDDPPRVIGVDAASPAQEAGIQLGDTITAVDDQPVASAMDYHIALINSHPGRVLRLQISRPDGDTVANLKLTARPQPDGAKPLWIKLGIQAKPLPPGMAQQSGFSGLTGLLVTQVESPHQPGAASPTRRSPIQPGDIIIQIDGHQVDGLEHAGEILEPVQPQQPVRITFIRVTGHTLYRISADVPAY